MSMSGIVIKSPIRRNVRPSSHVSHSRPPSTRSPSIRSPNTRSPSTRSPSRVSAAAAEIENTTQPPEMESALPISFRKGSLSRADQEILALIQQVPKKIANPCLESFYLYPIAQKVYQAVTSKMLPSELGVYIQDKIAKRKVYQLVFDTLYHREILEELLVESSFYSRYYHLHSQESLLLVMLFDFQSSKFTLQLRCDEMDSVPEATARVAEALWDHRTKLNATLARMRVQRDASSISQLIANPTVRKLYKTNQLSPLYARVNPIKVRDVQAEVINQLLNEGFMLVEEEEELCKYSYRSMCLLQKDLLAFSPGCRGVLDTHNLVESGHLVLQDIQSYKFVDGISDKIKNCSGDIVVTEANSGVEVAHIATILGYRGTVLVYNTQPTDIEQIQLKLLSLAVRNVRFMEMAFVCSCSEEDALDDVQMIICLPCVTPSIVGNRVDYALQEGEHRLSVILQPPTKAVKMSDEEQSLFFTSLSSALNFHQVENIFLVFSTESNSIVNSEALIKQILEQYNSKAEKIGLKNFMICTTSHHTCDVLGGQECFTTLIHREPEKPPPPPRTVINRAIAEGIIDGKGISDDETPVKKKGKLKRRRSKHAIPAMTIAAQQKIVRKKGPKQEPKAFRF